MVVLERYPKKDRRLVFNQGRFNDSILIRIVIVELEFPYAERDSMLLGTLEMPYQKVIACSQKLPKVSVLLGKSTISDPRGSYTHRSIDPVHYCFFLRHIHVAGIEIKRLLS